MRARGLLVRFFVGATLTFGAVFGCASRETVTPERLPAQRSATLTARPEEARLNLTQRLDRVDVLFGTRGTLPTEEPNDFPARIGAAKSFLRDRMSQDAFYDTLFSRMFDVLYTARRTVDIGVRALRSGTAAGKSFYYLDKPCAPTELVDVAPWWKPTEKVAICRRDYRPEVKQEQLEAGKTGEPRWCEVIETGETCGCGEYLWGCARDEKMQTDIAGAVLKEPIRTMQQIALSRQPFSRVLTMNESVRTEIGDFIYARSHFYSSGTAPSGLHEAGVDWRLRPRPTEFSGGVLTTPLYRFYEAPRTALSMAMNDFLCIPMTSVSVDAHVVLDLGDPRLRGRGHEGLAAKAGCSTCHARMEYGMRAYQGFSNYVKGIRYEPHNAYAGTTRLYVLDEHDMRAEGPATPAWFGETMAKQPEFQACMVRKVEEVVYQGVPVPAQVHARLESRFQHGQDIYGLLEQALLAWVVGPAALSESGAE